MCEIAAGIRAISPEFPIFFQRPNAFWAKRRAGQELGATCGGGWEIERVRCASVIYRRGGGTNPIRSHPKPAKNRSGERPMRVCPGMSRFVPARGVRNEATALKVD